MKIERRTFLVTGMSCLAWAAMPDLAAASNSRARFVITSSGPVDGAAAEGWGKLTTELQKRGFPTTLGAADDQIRPQWEQSAARRVLGVEPVVISGAGHANTVTEEEYAVAVAVACVKGL
jgi:hypothetical protein